MKDKLQQEILEKIKPGTKPSDIKKLSQKHTKKSKSPPPISISKSDSGYESDQHENETSNKSIPVAPPLPNQNLLDQITSLKKQLQLYKDFREGDLKLKEDLKKSLLALNKDNEKLKEENANLKETIAKLDSLLKQKQELSRYVNEPEDMNMNQVKTFTCADCNQTKPQSELSRVFGKFSFCLECSKKARQEAGKQKEVKPQPEDFTCHLCEKPKTEIPTLIKLDKTLTEYLICQECRPHAKEFNEADLITDELWEKYPYSSASEILELEFGIAPNKKLW